MKVPDLEDMTQLTKTVAEGGRAVITLTRWDLADAHVEAYADMKIVLDINVIVDADADEYSDKVENSIY